MKQEKLADAMIVFLSETWAIKTSRYVRQGDAVFDESHDACQRHDISITPH